MAWSVKGVGAAQACTLWLLSNLNGSARSGNERSGGVEGKRVFAMHLASALSIITLAECPTRCIILLWASRSWPSAPLGTLICFLHWKPHWTQVNMGAENDSPKVQVKMRWPTKCSTAFRLCVHLFCLRRETFEEPPKPLVISLWAVYAIRVSRLSVRSRNCCDCDVENRYLPVCPALTH